MIEEFSYSSAGRAEPSAFPEYVELYSHGVDVVRGEGRFAADIKAWRLNGILLFDRRVTGVVHSRHDRAAQDGFQHLVLNLVVSGQVIGSSESGFAQAAPDDIYIADTSRPSSTEFVEAHLITMSVDRCVIEAGLGTSGGLHGTVLRAPQNGMLADFMQSLARRAPILEPARLPAVARALVEILASVDAFASRASSEVRRQEFIRRELVENQIAAHLGDPSLSVNTISAGTNMSRSALYRLFETHGGIARLIQQRRVDGLRSAMDAEALGRDEGSAAEETAAELARRFGFSGEAQARRAFTTAFGLSPMAYIEALRAVDPAGATASYRRWKGWMTELT